MFFITIYVYQTKLNSPSNDGPHARGGRRARGGGGARRGAPRGEHRFQVHGAEPSQKTVSGLEIPQQLGKATASRQRAQTVFQQLISTQVR